MIRAARIAAVLAALAALSPAAAYGVTDGTVAALTAPASALQCQPVTLDASATLVDANATLTTIQWDTGSGFGAPIPLPTVFTTGQVPSTGMTYTVSFGTLGTHQVGVQVTDSLGAQSTATATVNITPAPIAPVPMFAASATVAYTGQPITFDGSGSYEATLGANCSPVIFKQVGGYTWDFGEGGVPVQAGAVVSHAFSSPGTYNVILRVLSTDPAGGQASATHTVTVLPAPSPPPPPQAPSPPPPPAVSLPIGIVKVDGDGYVKLLVRCLATSVACRGQLKLTALMPDAPKKKARRGSAAAAKPRQTIVLAQTSFSIAARKSKLIRMRLSHAGRTYVQSAGKKGLAATLAALPPAAAQAALAPAARPVRLVAAVRKRPPTRRSSHR
jgi:hypothetical protein